MTGEQLSQAIVTVKTALEANRNIISLALVHDLKRFVDALRVHPAGAEIANQVIASSNRATDDEPLDFNKMLEGLSQALDVEEQLVGSQGATMITVCDKLKDRRFILGLIGRFL